MATAGTTISCRAFAIGAILFGCLASVSDAADKLAPPRLPIAPHWSVPLDGGVSVAPVSDGGRVFLALGSAHLVARDAGDGHEIWRTPKNITTPMAADAGLVFVAAGEAIEALRGTDGASAWTLPRVKAAAPLIVAGGRLIVVTDAEVIAIDARDGAVAWRAAAGGVRQRPAIDGDRVFAGADDGRVLALDKATGSVLWERYVPGGVTTIAARRGLVYAGAGDKYLYCLDARTGNVKWPFRIGAIPSGPLDVDDDRVYVASLDNVIRALDSSTGNQRWQTPLSKRPIAGVRVLGHVVFVPVSGSELLLLFDRDGRRSGAIGLPGETTRETPPDLGEDAEGLRAFVVTGGLSNQWRLTFIGPVAEAGLLPFSAMARLPGVMFLTDPAMAPMSRVLPWLLLGDPVLQPLSAIEWPIVMKDPPLLPLTILPGLQLRPLSAVLPPRRGA